MKNELNAMIDTITATTPEPEDYTGEDGLLYCGKCHKPKEAYFAGEQGRYCLGLTATRQSATAREPPARNGRPPRSGAGTLTPWRN